MCGLVGIAGDTASDWKDVFTELLIIDSVRGMHSTGMANVRRFENQVAMLKKPGPSHFLISDEEYKKSITFPSKVIIGHNRHATIGSHTVENAHPFAFHNIVGAHNGTLEKHSIKKLHNYDVYGTDSEAIFATINEFGIQYTVDQLEGAWALTWFDKQLNTINFLRNDRRPLFYTYSKDRTTLIWASEESMLKYALSRHRKLDKDHKFFVSEPDQHLSWTIPEFITKPFDHPEKVERKAPTPLYVGFQYGSSWHYEDSKPSSSHHSSGKKKGYHSYAQGRVWDASLGLYVDIDSVDDKIVSFPTGGTKSTACKKHFEGNRDTKKFRPPYKDPTGKVMKKKDFFRFVADGCVMCNDNSMNWGDFIHPFKDQDGHHIFLCEDCYNDPDIQQACGYLI